MTIGQPHAQQRTSRRPAGSIVLWAGRGLEGVGEAPLSTRSLSTPRRRSACDATATSLHTAVRQNTHQAVPPSANRSSGRFSRASSTPQTTGISKLEGRRRLRTIVRRGVCDGTAASLFVKSRTQIPTTPRTARERPRTPTWSSRSRSRPTMRARPYPPQVIVSISGQFFTQQQT